MENEILKQIHDKKRTKYLRTDKTNKQRSSGCNCNVCNPKLYKITCDRKYLNYIKTKINKNDYSLL